MEHLIAERAQVSGQPHAVQLIVIVEGIASNLGHRVRHKQDRQTVALGKRVVADALQIGRQAQIHQTVAVPEGAVADLCHGVRETCRGHLLAAAEGVHADGGDAGVYNHFADVRVVRGPGRGAVKGVFLPRSLIIVVGITVVIHAARAVNDQRTGLRPIGPGHIIAALPAFAGLCRFIHNLNRQDSRVAAFGQGGGDRHRSRADRSQDAVVDTRRPFHVKYDARVIEAVHGLSPEQAVEVHCILCMDLDPAFLKQGDHRVWQRRVIGQHAAAFRPLGSIGARGCIEFFHRIQERNIPNLRHRTRHDDPAHVHAVCEHVLIQGGHALGQLIGHEAGIRHRRHETVEAVHRPCRIHIAPVEMLRRHRAKTTVDHQILRCIGKGLSAVIGDVVRQFHQAQHVAAAEGIVADGLH